MATGKSKEIEAMPDVVKDQPVADYVPGSAWEEATAGADQVLGHDLAKDALFDALAGVPFLITRFTFREGIKNARTGRPSCYVSCEAVIPPADVLRRRRVPLEELPFSPGDQIVFNDGSTGIYRQVVAYLASRGIIPVDTSLPENAPYGESRYDVYIPSIEPAAGELLYRPDGNWSYTVNARLYCPRGIRISSYESDYNPNGSQTRYLA